MLDDVVPCRHRDGTHRAVAPRQTLERFWPLAPLMGITRLADVTGLDCVGIPVVMAVRPNARSLAVSQGKGLTRELARASALMEAIELHHAERVVLPLKLGSIEELRYDHALLDLEVLPRDRLAAVDPYRPILWVEGVDIQRGRGVWVPFAIVHTAYGPDATALPATGCLAMSSNGLASGNHPLEAIAHGVYECIERDATGLFTLATETGREARRLDLATVDDPSCRVILERLARAAVLVAVWDVTSDVGLPVYSATICERDPSSARAVGAAHGSGCHPAREIALARALTEAVQSRLTVVSGARDDMSRSIYRKSLDRVVLERLRAELLRDGTRPFHAAPGVVADTANEELAHAAAKLSAAGFTQIVAVDLTRRELRVPVVRVVVPGLEGDANDGETLLGPRAAARFARAMGEGGAA